MNLGTERREGERGKEGRKVEGKREGRQEGGKGSSRKREIEDGCTPKGK